MKIDRSNYEIWFIDSLDGNLNSHQADQLTQFLNENPDLREEFNELNLATVEPINKPFPLKEKLKKLPSDITQSQFEYLSVAYLENDLTPDQRSEILHIVANDADKKRNFDLIQKSRIVPFPLIFKNKNRLIRRTAKEKIIRFSVIGLSAAAVIALIVTTFLKAPGNISSDINNLSVNSNPETNTRQPAVEIIAGTQAAEVELLPVDNKNLKVHEPVQERRTDASSAELISQAPIDSTIINASPREPDIKKIELSTQISVKEAIYSGKLVASATVIINPEEDDGRNGISRFISKTFREKIMKEKLSTNKPIKGYEIAEAGVTGLNKIFGWEMALDRNEDEAGQLKSVYFSSRMVKFTAPVKKSESAQ